MAPPASSVLDVSPYLIPYTGIAEMRGYLNHDEFSEFDEQARQQNQAKNFSLTGR